MNRFESLFWIGFTKAANQLAMASPTVEPMHDNHEGGHLTQELTGAGAVDRAALVAERSLKPNNLAHAEGAVAGEAAATSGAPNILKSIITPKNVGNMAKGLGAGVGVGYVSDQIMDQALPAKVENDNSYGVMVANNFRDLMKNMGGGAMAGGAIGGATTGGPGALPGATAGAVGGAVYDVANKAVEGASDVWQLGKSLPGAINTMRTGGSAPLPMPANRSKPMPLGNVNLGQQMSNNVQQMKPVMSPMPKPAAPTTPQRTNVPTMSQPK